ncbi:hypothetical protein SLE2022_004360 [Rubroshorea leprosula]
MAAVTLLPLHCCALPGPAPTKPKKSKAPSSSSSSSSSCRPSSIFLKKGRKTSPEIPLSHFLPVDLRRVCAMYGISMNVQSYNPI